jgi:hypothetical protein
LENIGIVLSRILSAIIIAAKEKGKGYHRSQARIHKTLKISIACERRINFLRVFPQLYVYQFQGEAPIIPKILIP